MWRGPTVEHSRSAWWRWPLHVTAHPPRNHRTASTPRLLLIPFWPLDRLSLSVGYDGIVFTQTIHEKYSNKIKNTMTPIPLSELSVVFPAQTSALRLSSSSSPFTLGPAGSFSAFQQKFRLHLHISDASHLAPLSSHSPSLLSYDLLSASPTTTDLFHACASSDYVDLISLPTHSKLPFHIRRPSLHMAHERGIALELAYAPGLRDGGLRRYLFACGVAVLRMGGGGKGVVVSSGAEKEGEMRDVAGVISVLRLMGMEGERARAALSVNAEKALWKGETRRTSRAVLRVIRTQVGAEEEKEAPVEDGTTEQNPPSKRRKT